MSFGQGGSQWSPGGSHNPWDDQYSSTSNRTPDWASLAEQSEIRNRRRRLLMIVGGALATVGIGVAVAVAVVNNDSGSTTANGPNDLPTAADIPSASAKADPSFAPTSAPPPLDPKEFISSSGKDKAPISPDILFPGSQLTKRDGVVYRKGATASTTNCASAVQGSLDTLLTGNDCTRFLRVTYVRDKIAVTIGVALFDTEAKATKVKKDWDKKSTIVSLPGEGVATFCRTTFCRTTANSYGRYAYFTLSGFTDGKDVTEKDKAVFAAGDDLSQSAYEQIHRRGETQAAAAAGGQ
ncbi:MULTISPECIES: hypothetical protein [Streptomyces]|uniref:Uncharacterized protein n=2 Tax=Streptomyces TaxID=1883 RepID=A0A8I0TT90_9ACTN|nr:MULTISPECIES: hypothetical protein [Streptomyces]KND34750.1 membrane protein [Streptomyces stelliscabiei]MBE1599437.1 hypothetical protein [Streptomyces stelliscabiei]MDX2520873.1 hypothetical protein [Streptomyces stelliscabiei]MDX2553984.1 hypothetical protein [Streptomyces stelliscabiei]MDX2612727.1 hypothetical protein [Streptomyces stelliscabiei]